MARRILPAVLLAIASCADEAPVTKQAPAQEPAPCSPALLDEGRLPPGPQPDGSHVLHDGRRLTPEGAQVEVGNFPVNVVATPDGRFAITSDAGYGMRSQGYAQSLTVVDLASRRVASRLLFPNPEEVFYGLAVSPDGRTLYASSGGGSSIRVLALDGEGQLSERTRWQLGRAGEVSVITGLALSPEGDVLYVAQMSRGQLAALSTADGSVIADVPAGKAPYAVRLAGGRVWVSLWAQSNRDADPIVASFAAADLSGRRTVPVGKNPEGLAASPDGATLFVASSDGDAIDVVDAATGVRRASFSVRDPAAPGSQPLDVAVAPDGRRLFVPLAGEAAVAVLSAADGAVLGKIPTAHYPSAVALTPDGATLLVTNGKGVGSGPALPDDADFSSSLAYVPGTLSIVPVPTDEALAALTAKVKANNERWLAYYERCAEGHTNPLPAVRGGPTPIEHVVYILRENKTYDQVLGDLEVGNGDPSLAMFGERFTPNLHALAREFVNLDNCHSEAEISFQGHVWSVGATNNDYLEKLWIGGYRSEDRIPVLAGVEIASWPAGGFIFQRALASGVEFYNYGELAGFTGDFEALGEERIAPFAEFAPSPDIDFDDVTRAQAFARDLDSGRFPPFVFLTLPQDHTFGVSEGKPTPEWMVANNDHATGLIVEAISRSRYWEKTLVILTEDDPQSGADHVDAHRTVCLLISPWVKRHHVSSQQTSVAGLMTTYEYILGLEPLALTDAQAAPLWDAFTDRPDPTPFTALPSQIPLEQGLAGGPGYALTAGLDFTRIDEQPELGLALWERMRPDAPAPAQLVGQAQRLRRKLDRIRAGTHVPEPELDGEVQRALEQARWRRNPLRR